MIYTIRFKIVVSGFENSLNKIRLRCSLVRVFVVRFLDMNCLLGML